MKRCALLLAALILSGCPEAPEHVKTADPGGAPGGQGGGQGGPGMEGEAGPPPDGGAGGPAGVNIAEDMKYSQETLAESEDTLSVSGELVCSSDGPYWVYLFPPPPSPDDVAADQEPVGPVTGIKLAAAGPFSFKAPKGGTAMLLAFQDQNDDGIQKPGEPLFIGNDGQPITLGEDISGAVLDCDKNAVGLGGGPPE